ncbi:MAG: class II glutamine amidotransferase [Desulfosudis oleivorans]|nr:class II glutamine amidotransferase [Desulfosudis oleivorans]
MNQADPREECGVFAIYGHEEAARVDFLRPFRPAAPRAGIRGHCHAPTAVRYRSTKAWGWPPRYSRKRTLQKLPGTLAIGHVRYSTTGSSTLSNAQPFLVHFGDEYYALAHNGNIVNAQKLARRTGKQRFDFPINDGQRSHHPSDGAASEKGIGRSADQRALTEWKALTASSC